VTGGRLKPVGLFDLELLATLSEACFGESHWNRQTVAEVLAMPGAFGTMVLVEDVPAGFLLARLAADECEILSLGVHPSCRRRGLARRLLREALAQAASAAARSVFLEVGEDNERARNFYMSEGFEQVGRRPEYYHRPCGVAIAALIFRLELSQGYQMSDLDH